MHTMHQDYLQPSRIKLQAQSNGTFILKSSLLSI